MPHSTTAPQPLIDRVLTYNPAVDQALLQKAYDFAAEMHAPQKRASGEPYITHPYAVAGILAEMKLDPASIMTALLHDTVEDTPATLEDIKSKFGAEVASLVDGVSKLTRIESQTVEGKQAENFRKLVLAMSEDIRVLLVKLADRLHNMRTIEAVEKPEKRRRIAKETLDIYAPLAERIGVNTIKEELEDLSFAVMHPEARDSITNRLSFLRSEGSSIVSDIITRLNSDMKEAGIDAQITGREKTRHSIWRKMQRKNISFEQLSDIMAFRIVVPDIAACYHALGVLHSHYPVVPGRFKDYISTPKPNGYRSLHTTVIGPANQRIEMQIRTREMHEEADLGVAAHWGYKAGRKPGEMADVKQFRWLRELLDIIQQEKTEDIMESTKMELFQDMVYCFTPKGDLIELPSGACPVDFAYAVHSGVGDRCVGAKINGRIAPLNTKLNNGDQVDVQTSKTGTPNPTWERFVITGKARTHIRKYVKQQQRDEYLHLGRAMLQKVFRQEDEDFTEKGLLSALKFYRAETTDDLFVMVGMGHLVARDVYKHLFPGAQIRHTGAGISEDPEALAAMLQNSNAQKAKRDKPLPIVGLIPGMAVHYARCCHPVPGDRIVGIVTTGKGVTIHTVECETLESFADTPERWLDVAWGEADEQANRVSRVNITIFNRQGALGAITNIVAKHNGNITNFKITNRSPDFWDLYMDIAVNDVDHLNNVLAALRSSPHVSDADRAKNR